MSDYYLFKESLNLNWYSLGSIGYLIYIGERDNKLLIRSIDKKYKKLLDRTHPLEDWSRLIKHEILYT